MAAGPDASRVWRAPGVVVALLLLPIPLIAQEVGGGLEGTVRDPENAPLPNARVNVSGASLLGTSIAICDRGGRFHVALLPVGDYDVRIRLLGYRELELPHVRVDLGRTTDVGDVRLDVEAITVAGTHTVAARAAGDAMRPVAGGRLSADAMRGLPSDRDYQSIVTLLPSASVTYFGDRANISGTSGPESNYYVDGSNVVEPPGNTVSTSLPYNFVEAVQVMAGGYQAEYGGAGGGIVNAVTRSGGNEFSGQAFGFFANRLFTMTSTPARELARTTDYSSWDAGASLGGPLLRDRLWFFIAYDPAVERENLVFPDFGGDRDVRVAHRLAGKLTARLDDRTRLTLSAVGDPTRRRQRGGTLQSGIRSLGNPDPILGAQEGGGGSVSLHATRTIGTRSYVVVDATTFASRYVFDPATARGALEPLYVDATAAYAEGGFGSATERHARRAAVRAAAGTQRGRHVVKAGVGYDDEYAREHLVLNQITRVLPQVYQYVTLPDRVSDNHMRVPTTFVQDTWRATDRVTIDVGLRVSEEFWIASGGQVGQKIPWQWQPRAGVGWALGRRRDASVFGSWGRFDQRTRLNLPGFFLQDVPSTYLVRLFDHDPRIDPSGGSIVGAQTLGHQPAVAGLRGAEFDEVELGAERRFADVLTLRVRGVSRWQRHGIVGVSSPVNGQVVYGNPGVGELGAYPPIARRYRAVELTLEDGATGATRWSVSYVVSSLRGNYEGYWDQSAGTNDQLGGGAFMPFANAATYALGPLPGDRRHQLKARASRSLGFGCSAGVTLLWSSGTPISELGSTPYPAPYFRLLSPRGSRGRTPSIYDLDLRLTYDPPFLGPGRARPRLLADAYHLGNPRRPVVYDELHYLHGDAAGNQSSPNPSYGKVLQFQPAVAYRFGVEVSW